MAAAEARTAWQRTAGRCFAHEDSRKAPKLSSCQSSSSSSKSEPDHVPDNAKKGPNKTAPDWLPPNPSSHVRTDRKWWLNPESHFGCHNSSIVEQQITLEAKLEVLSDGFVNIIADDGKNGQLKEEFSTKTGTESNSYSSMEQLGVNDSQKGAMEKDLKDYWHSDDDFMNLDSLNCLVSQEPKKLSSDFESLWVGSDKSEPWWRTAGKSDLASMVAQKSQEHIENCDLPRPRAKNYRKRPSATSQSFPNDYILASSLDRMAETGFLNLDYNTLGNQSLGYSPHDSDQPFCGTSGFSTTNIDYTDAPNNLEIDQSKAQLLKALCLSQTRAREAEKAAKQAYNEKEHIITLLFRQASQLFAYKQWLQLLQLENICLQLKNKNQPICNLFGPVLPWGPSKARQAKKGQHKAGKKRHGKPRYELHKSFVAFALGLGLASAGLLLGWTMGWLFPNA